MFARVGAQGAKRCVAFKHQASLHFQAQSQSVGNQPPASSTSGLARYCSHTSSMQTTSEAHGAGAPPSVNFLRHATGDYELHTRLAALWGMPSELLFERQQAVQALMGPAGGFSSAAHALWLLIRSPELRHTPEALLRHRVRQLHALVSHTHIDRAAVLTGIYRHPWILGAMADSTPPAAASASHQRQQQQPAAAHTRPGSSRAQQPSAAACSTPNAAVCPATWLQELAAVVLELQQADHVEHVSSGKARRGGLTSSPGYAAAAVRTYLAVGEAKQSVLTAVNSLAQLFAPKATPAPPAGAAPAAAEAEAEAAAAPRPVAVAGAPTATVGWPHPDSPLSSSPPSPAAPSSTAGNSSSSNSAPMGGGSGPGLPPATGMSEVMQRLQQQHQQHLLLQQLLASCPHLIALPPELLLARYQRLLSVVNGCVDAAHQLLLTSPYLLMDYDDSDAGKAEVNALRAAYA